MNKRQKKKYDKMFCFDTKRNKLGLMDHHQIKRHSYSQLVHQVSFNRIVRKYIRYMNNLGTVKAHSNTRVRRVFRLRKELEKHDSMGKIEFESIGFGIIDRNKGEVKTIYKDGQMIHE